ncbi:MAG TPA: YHS domain-containing protein [Ignavibacteriales bacterium]|nr:YHS domain-containing protein [Ignavibacteriales bacterium]
MSRDPVCGMRIDESKAAAKSEYKGKTFYFCCTKCKDSFAKEPSKYAAKVDIDSLKDQLH